MPFQPTEAQLSRWVSTERLNRYRATGRPVVPLYLWNAETSAACFESIGHVEVLLRNVIHRQLAAHSGGERWYLDRQYRLTSRAQDDVSTARFRARTQNGIESPGKVVAELTFGFWRFLLTRRYQTTIWPRISPGFAGVASHRRHRAELESAVKRIHVLRNRVAHHEPIFHLPIRNRLDDMLLVARYVDGDAERMLQESSRVDLVLARSRLTRTWRLLRSRATGTSGRSRRSGTCAASAGSGPAPAAPAPRRRRAARRPPQAPPRPAGRCRRAGPRRPALRRSPRSRCAA
ncbi:hypothetical protein BKD30_06890 [Tersicoccus phoenicis]|uniref:CAAX protease n=1 Tax=Tersicoccus phoenicis TaxID=554083 RepID=A0A1R1LBP0_9MICC|nr:hypothetical protein BKD30_06890 [Tersicoccus phoenicis]